MISKISFTRISVLFAVALLFILAGSCEQEAKDNTTPSTSEIVIQNNQVVVSSLIGHGAQWGGYDLLPEWTGQKFFSQEDWNKLTRRIDFLKPRFVRIMIDAGWNYAGEGYYDEQYKPERLLPILEYCQKNDITVLFGEWGHKYLNNTITDIKHEWVGWAAEYLNWLINDHGFTCIEYYNMVNEPNGNWSTTDGNYRLWRDLMQEFSDSLSKKNLADDIVLTGPDIAVWDNGYLNWMDRTQQDLGEQVGLYDIHTYPGQEFVRSGEFRNLLDAYQEAVPSGKQIVVSEIGFKYNEADGDLKEKNEQREDADPYASDDSNMMVYDSFYGVDMADAIIQAMLEGYAGAIVWNMDDAMYNSPDYEAGDSYAARKLKRWGFWNILGDEVFADAPRGAIDEQKRPWFYTMSLLCRYFPDGMEVYDVELPDKKGLRAVAGKYNDLYTLAIVNSNYSGYDNVVLRFEEGLELEGLKKYYFESQTGSRFKGNRDDQGFAMPEKTDLSLDLDEGERINIPGQSLTVYTSISYQR